MIVESDNDKLRNYPVQNRNEAKIDFGLICKINSISLNGKQWITVISHCGILKFILVGNRDEQMIIPDQIVDYRIDLNVVDFDINESDNQILIKFQSGSYTLFRYGYDLKHSVRFDVIQKWDLNKEFYNHQLKMRLNENSSEASHCCFQSSNISRMTYKKSPKALFCVVLNVLCKDELDHQLIAYFDSKRIIFEKICAPLKSTRVKPRRPPLFQGHLKAETRFGCVSQQCQLSAVFVQDCKKRGPVLTSFLSRDSNRELGLSDQSSKLQQVQEDAEIIGFSKLDVLSDDNEEVVICNATGLTYILSSKTNQEIIRYHHRKGIKYFTCGILGTKPCFIYITSWNTLEIFSNVQLPYFNKKCILEAVEESIVIRDYFRDKKANTKSQKRDIIRSLLYSEE